jgi:hypothetical protein
MTGYGVSRVYIFAAFLFRETQNKTHEISLVSRKEKSWEFSFRFLSSRVKFHFLS